MPNTTYYGLKYELRFDGDTVWTDISSLVNSKTVKVEMAGCSEELKSVISTCSFEMRYGTESKKTEHSETVGRILTAKHDGTVVRFRMSGIATFVGRIDLGSFSQKNSRIPGFLTVTCEDNSYLLDEKMPTAFEYPDNDDLDDEGWAVFDKADLAHSIVMQRFLDAGYTVDQIDVAGSDTIAEKVRRVVYDEDDGRSYRDFLDTLLYEYCAVLYTTAEGKLSVRRLYKENPVSEREVDRFLTGDGIETRGGDYEYDGAKVVWSTLSRLDKAVVYNSNILTSLDDEGNRVGEEIQPLHYWPKDGDIEETWQEFNATFLDRPYQTNMSRLRNKDLSLISVKNAYYEVAKDPEILIANNPPEIRPTKARVLWWNSDDTNERNLYGFTIVGNALFRSKLNESTYPPEANRLNESPYESEFVFDSEVAQRLVNHLHRFKKYGDLQHRWAEINVDTPMFQVVTVSAPDTQISTLAMVISQSITFPAPNKVKRHISGIGITPFSSEPVKTRSTQIGGAPVNTGPAGASGTRSVVQFILGTIDGPYSEESTALGTDEALVGTQLAVVGVDGASWTYTAPIPDVGEFVWRREGYYVPPDKWPKTWNITRLSGADRMGIEIAPSVASVPVTARGTPKVETINLAALLINIPPSYKDKIVWNSTGIDINSDNELCEADVLTMFGDSAFITATVDFDQTYTATATLTKVYDGKPSKANMGLIDTYPLPNDYDGEPLVKGDYFLWGGANIPEETYEDIPNGLTKGEIYENDGRGAWHKSSDGDLVMTMFDSFAEIANDVDSQVIGNAIIKKLVSIDAFIKNLQAENLKAGQGTGLANSGFRFRAQTDSVGDGSDVPVFDVMYNSDVLFKVDPSTGKIYFGTNFWYDPADGAIHTPNNKTVINADGTIEAVDGSFTGNIVANSGLFKGVFDTTVLKLEPGDATPVANTQGSGVAQAERFYDYFLGQGLLEATFYKVGFSSSSITIINGYGSYNKTFNTSNISFVQLKKIWSTNYYYRISFYDSTFNELTYLYTRYYSDAVSIDTNISRRTTATITMTILYGGDRLIVSEDLPQLPAGLSDYQVFMSSNGDGTATLKVKLP